jgi:hypothetical protein
MTDVRAKTARPATAGIHLRLTAYEKAGNEPKRMATLEALMAMAPALPSAAALSEIYFRNGRDDTRTLLSRFLKELTVENGLLLRLAEFDVAAGAKDEAIAVLKRPS